MKRVLLLTAIGLIVAYGLWEGMWTDRWSQSQEPQRVAARLPNVPLIIGHWVGKDRQLDQRQVARAEMSGYLLRDYTQQNTKTTVTVLLICGKPGPTSLHPPDICYQGAGYTTAAEPARHQITGEPLETPADFKTAQFVKSGPSADPLRIFWAWSATGTWSAPDYPRWTFGGSPFLCKLYVIREMKKQDEPLDKEEAIDFIRVFLPELRTAVFSESAPATKSAQMLLPAGLSKGRQS